MRAPRTTLLASLVLAGYVIALLSFVLFGAHEPDLLVPRLLFSVPWLASPATFAARLVFVAADDPLSSWGNLPLETLVICSVGWATYYLYRHPDAQNGIALALLPRVQFGGIAVGLLGLFLFQALLRRARHKIT